MYRIVVPLELIEKPCGLKGRPPSGVTLTNSPSVILGVVTPGRIVGLTHILSSCPPLLAVRVYEAFIRVLVALERDVGALLDQHFPLRKALTANIQRW